MSKPLPLTLTAIWDPIEGEYRSVTANRPGLGIIHGIARDSFQANAEKLIGERGGEDSFYIRYLPSGEHIRCVLH